MSVCSKVGLRGLFMVREWIFCAGRGLGMAFYESIGSSIMVSLL